MLEELIAERLKKLARLKKAGVNPYPAKAERSHEIGEVLRKFSSLSKGRKKVSVAGRIMGLRDQGGVVFLDLRDESGQIQAVLKKDDLKEFELFRETLDRGDFVSVSGLPFVTKRGEKSVAAEGVQILTKSLRSLPTEWYGVEDEELRLRRRYLDVLLNKEAREIFRKKAEFWDVFRSYLKKEGFLELEMPVLEQVPGGAEAEPFVTHHKALDTDFYLRISLELPLKKALVAGYDAVFEIGRIFRNEGVSREHLQDYTQLEFYWAYRDYNDCMKLAKEMYLAAVKKVAGGLKTVREGREMDWGGEWPRVEYVEIFQEKSGLNPLTASLKELFAKAESVGAEPEKNAGRGRLVDMIFKKTARPGLWQPCFLVNPPAEIEPLAKRSEKDPRVVERFQIMAGGTELGKGFSELNDPIDQRARFEEQMKLREAGDKEAQMLDEDFLEALEYGMPPACGFGVSERFFAVLMDKSVRETVFFPLMRPKQ